MRRILLLYILLTVIGLTSVHAQFDNGRQVIDENGYDQYGNQVDPAMIPENWTVQMLRYRDCLLNYICGVSKTSWATGL